AALRLPTNEISLGLADSSGAAPTISISPAPSAAPSQAAFKRLAISSTRKLSLPSSLCHPSLYHTNLCQLIHPLPWLPPRAYIPSHASGRRRGSGSFRSLEKTSRSERSAGWNLTFT